MAVKDRVNFYLKQKALARALRRLGYKCFGCEAVFKRKRDLSLHQKDRWPFCASTLTLFEGVDNSVDK